MLCAMGRTGGQPRAIIVCWHAVSAIKQFGKGIGDQKMAAEGKIEKNVGKAQNAIGGMKDALRDADKNAKKN